MGLSITMLFCFSCGSQNSERAQVSDREVEPIILGIEQFDLYLPQLRDKNVAAVVNQTSILDSDSGNHTHLIDFLLKERILVKEIFSPEHGFRGFADAGERVEDGKDITTGLPILSLHGKHKKPSKEQLNGIDVVLFDIQDVGVRFYTYISTLHYVMEACAESGIPLILLDRPNPNGHYIDGPMMAKEHTSFLGMHTVPLVYGMTIGEYALMINREGWLANGLKCDLAIIPLKNYTHQTPYSLPVRPSPNLPNDVAINLYPSLGLLEGTNVNAGRGTEMQFQVVGSPYLPSHKYPFSYTPQPNFGSKSPKFKGINCNGIDLRKTPRMDRVDLKWIIEVYQNYTKKEDFFNTSNFTTHAGTSKLQQQIEAGMTSKEIRVSWKNDLATFQEIRKKYLLYD